MAASSSSSSSLGARSNMSRLMASSRLSSYQPKVSQVYTASPSHISRGDFGVKRPLPTSHLSPGIIRYVEIGNQDSKEGQTEWREREREVILLKRFKELNIKVGTKSSSNSDIFRILEGKEGDNDALKAGALGPRINTTYDPSTRRVVPTHYDGIPKDKDDIKSYLQAEARLGRGPLYMDSLQGEADGGPFGKAAQLYTTYPSSRTNFRTMNQKQFDNFLEHIRSNREAYKDHLATRAAKMARMKVASRYKKEREMKELEAQQAQETGATKVEVPGLLSEKDLPLPARSDDLDEKGVYVDLWDEVRASSTTSLWESWLQGQNSAKIRAASSDILPPISKALGGEEIPTSQHILGGLQYAQPDSITTSLLNDTIPARAIGKGLKQDEFRKHSYASGKGNAGLQGLSVAIGGRIAYMPFENSDYAKPLDPSLNDPHAGNLRVKVFKAIRETKKDDESQNLTFQRFAPRHDDKLPASFGNTLLAVRSVESSERTSLAKGVPGSSEWIGRLNGYLGLQSGQGDDGVLNLAGGSWDSMSARRSRSFSAAIDQQDPNLSPSERRRRARRERLGSPSQNSEQQFKFFKNITKASDRQVLRRQEAAALQSKAEAEAQK
ncbi:hypothetical protein CBS101457_000520 [Exobasidium rhododendri]|nr:hypothetical protein CBS101457_000520 [Exobasidium rhododendri]